MPKAGVLQAKAQEAGISVKELCKLAVEQNGNEFKAALALGVYPNTVRYHLTQPDDQPKKADKVVRERSDATA